MEEEAASAGQGLPDQFEVAGIDAVLQLEEKSLAECGG